MSRYSKQSFFYQQRKRTTSNRRAKKQIDTQSVIGDRRESILVFRPGVGLEEDLGNIRLQAKAPGANNRQRRPSSAASRKSSVWFPPIDPTGPHLTTIKGATEDIVLETKEEAVQPKQPKYKFNEIKIASTSILTNLTRRFEAITNNISEIELPESLVNILILSFYQLVSDTIIEKREWQTDCYIDYKPNKLFLPYIPNQTDPIRQTVESSLNNFLKQQESNLRKKKRTRNMSDISERHERPLTAKSTMSAVSMKSDISEADSRVDYDKLPPELRMQGPEILRHRRESKAPKPKIPGPRTRLERFNNLKKKANDERLLKAKKSIGTLLFPTKLVEKKLTEDTDSEVTRRTQITSINFSMSSKDCADHGWIVHPSKTRDPEGFTLYQWANTRLQEAMRQREESHMTAKLRGEDGPLIVKYYSDPHYRPFKGARHRATSFPLPNVLSKLPPSLATFTSHTHNDVFLSQGDGQTICSLLLPDGSGFCNYYSGRRAISLSRKGDGSHGLFVIVFDDTVYNNVIGYFMPDGRISCYHKNGGLHILTDLEGGMLMDEDSITTRQWNWPKDGEKMTYSVSIQLNTHILFQCSGQYQMILKFSCHGQMHRFSVGLVYDSIDSDQTNESFWLKRSTIISSRLQSNIPFQSEAARNCYKVQDVDENVQSKQCKPQSSERESKQKQHHTEDSLNGSLTGSLSKWDGEPNKRELELYKNKIRNIVEDWLNYYRQTIGITPLSRISQHDSSTLRLMSSQSARPGLLQLSQSSSRWHSSVKMAAITPIVSRPLTPMDLDTLGAVEEELIYSRPISSLDQFIRRPQSQEETHKPFRVGPAKQRQRPPIRLRPGCPLALHKMILNGFDEMPVCRCDKRKIPIICDLEFDIFITSHVPLRQLVIVVITDSYHSKDDQSLLLSLHEKQNTNRYAPCQQSGRDIFRLLKYDLHSSINDLNTAEPLLVTRHNISSGMFLMYMSGKLTGIYTGFNGYGTTKKDFFKQIQRSIDNGSNGQFLPKDFKFSHSSVKVHSHNLWAYPVSGVFDEMISPTTSVLTTPSMCSILEDSDTVIANKTGSTSYTLKPTTQ